MHAAFAKRLAVGLSALMIVGLTAELAEAARCGNNSGGFEGWKRDFSREAARNGVGKRGQSALAGTRYSTATIRADRGQKSFKLSLNQFMAKRESVQQYRETLRRPPRTADRDLGNGEWLRRFHGQLQHSVVRCDARL